MLERYTTLSDRRSPAQVHEAARRKPQTDEYCFEQSQGDQTNRQGRSGITSIQATARTALMVRELRDPAEGSPQLC